MCTIILGNSVAISYKVKHISIICPNHSIPRYSVRKNESTGPLKDLYLDCHCRFICNSQKLETTKMSLNKWFNKWWYIYTIGYYSAQKKKKNSELLVCATTWMYLKAIMLSKRISLRRPKLYFSIDVTFSK